MTRSARKTEGEGCRNEQRGHVQDEPTAGEEARGVEAEAPKTAEERGEKTRREYRQADRGRKRDKRGSLEQGVVFCWHIARG